MFAKKVGGFCPHPLVKAGASILLASPLVLTPGRSASVEFAW